VNTACDVLYVYSEMRSCLIPVWRLSVSESRNCATPLHHLLLSSSRNIQWSIGS